MARTGDHWQGGEGVGGGEDGAATGGGREEPQREATPQPNATPGFKSSRNRGGTTRVFFFFCTYANRAATVEASSLFSDQHVI